MDSSTQSKVSSYYLNPAALCTYAGLSIVFLASLKFAPNESDYRWICAFIIAIVSGIASTFNFRRFLGLQEIPVSTIAAAAQGYIELMGETHSLLAMKSPIHGVDCVWYRLWIYVCNDSGIWQLEKYTSSQNIFGLHDQTGYCEVNPAGAEVIAAKRLTQHNNNHRYIEDVLPVGEDVYVLGELNSLNQQPSEANLWREANQLAVTWKQNPARLKARFDLNIDGIVDMQEWEYARREAYQEVSRQYDPRMNDKHIISKPKQSNRLYLISGVSPHTLRARYQFWAATHFAVFCIFAVVLIGFGL